MIHTVEPFLGKAEETLAGAESEYVSGRYTNCANRCYYACFQAAIQALLRTEIRPRGAQAQFSHEFVQAEFVGQLINRRKLYPADLRDVLLHTLAVRRAADYGKESVSEKHVLRALRRTRELVRAVRGEGVT